MFVLSFWYVSLQKIVQGTYYHLKIHKNLAKKCVVAVVARTVALLCKGNGRRIRPVSAMLPAFRCPEARSTLRAIPDLDGLPAGSRGRRGVAGHERERHEEKCVHCTALGKLVLVAVLQSLPSKK